MKTALVLSAGGMFGAYQAGVWKALEPVFQPDAVIGCSVGSINGWAIASGIAGDELARIWLDPRCATLMEKRPARRRWRSYFDPAPLAEMAQELTSTYTPRVPFGLAVTRLPQLRLEIIQTPHITWQHIVASCAIPTGFPPVRIGGQLYCDGGLLSVMPVWAAPAFGVHRIIAVNVLPSMPLNALRACVRMVRLLAPREPRVTGVAVLRLGPPRVLGTLRDAITWDPANIQRWIDRGQADAGRLINSPAFTATADRFV
ncbi:MAG TPA: patatin-like phospholipase family protein [Bryobacteraceae bacterium]|nr:patatin-like phospholipase family protein [Bryobacteraceae bacterium]